MDCKEYNLYFRWRVKLDMRGSKKCIVLLMAICLSLGVFFQTNASDIIPEEQLMTSSYRKAYVKENEIKIYKFKKENKKLDKALKKLQKTKKVAVTEKGKIGVGSYWVKTNKETDVYYVGKVKDNKPNGQGCLYKKISAIDLGLFDDVEKALSESYYVKMYEGNFKKGKLDGFGRKYILPTEEFEVDGNKTEIVPLILYKEISDDVELNLNETANPLCYEGFFKGNKYSGKGNKYEYLIMDKEKIITDILEDNLEESSENIQEENLYDDYILPYSDKEILTEEELKGLSQYEIWIAKNEIYARHGRIFDDSQLREYFNSKSWYSGTIMPEDFNERYFNEIEKENIKILSEYETTAEGSKSNAEDDVVVDNYSEDSVLEEYYSSEINVYTGTFKNNKQNGKCKIYYQGQLLYDGELKKGEINGEGTVYYPGTTQIKYQGKWKDGKFHGEGTFYDENGEETYSGEWDMGDYAS